MMPTRPLLKRYTKAGSLRTPELTDMDMTFDSSGLRSEKEIAKELGVDPQTVGRWRRTKGLPFFRIGRKVMIRLDDILEWGRTRSIDKEKA